MTPLPIQPVVGDTTTRGLAALAERDCALPGDGLTMEKVRTRAFAFRFESVEVLSFCIERHPAMYLTGIGIPGLDASPAWLHVLTEYQLNLSEGTWSVQELDSTFEYELWMIIEAELGDTGAERTTFAKRFERSETPIRRASGSESAGLNRRIRVHHRSFGDLNVPSNITGSVNRTRLAAVRTTRSPRLGIALLIVLVDPQRWPATDA